MCTADVLLVDLILSSARPDRPRRLDISIQTVLTPPPAVSAAEHSPALSAPPRAAAPPLTRIGVITTNRADYGIYCPLLEALQRRGGAVEIFAGGTHPESSFGDTLEQIRSDGFGRVHVVRHHVAGDRGADLAGAAGAATVAFAAALEASRPDLVFMLGDRYEMLAAALAAALLKIPMAHLHGGDLTEGAYDDQFRHALSKLSHLHFAALPEHARRLRRMGEEPWRVHVVGGLALDALARFQPEPAALIHAEAGLDASVPTIVLAYHPETLGDLAAADAFECVARGVERFAANILVIGSNADEGYLGLRAAVQRWAARRPRTARVASLPQPRFWSWLHHAAVLVGNSSTGIIEAPSLGLPAVNIGDRQRGRRRAANVIDVPADSGAIAAAVRRAVAPEFRTSLHGRVNPYGDGHAAERILAVIGALPPAATLLRKCWSEGEL